MAIIQSLKYAFYLIFHPFNGFWDLKNERRGRIESAVIIFVTLMVTYILKRQISGFLFNYNDLTKLNIFNEAMKVVIPVVLWCISNWCITTLVYGEGSFKDIVITTAYAVVPLIIVNIPLILLSNIIIKEEGTFYYFFSALAIVWTAFLIFIGIMTVHQYTPRESLLVIIATIFSMSVIIFITLLFFNLIQQLVTFSYTVYKEILFRN